MWIFDHNIVEVDLREGGYEEFGFGRKSYKNAEDPPGWLAIDDRPYKLVFGTYDLETGELHLRQCGPNMRLSRYRMAPLTQRPLDHT